jgi:hypothetical protein
MAGEGKENGMRRSEGPGMGLRKVVTLPYTRRVPAFSNILISRYGNIMDWSRSNAATAFAYNLGSGNDAEARSLQ